MINKIFNNIYNYYVLPMIVLHELCHILTAFILNIKILKVEFYKNKQFNMNTILMVDKQKYKYILVAFSPSLILFSLILLFIFVKINIILYICSLYIITCIKNRYFLFSPSLSDIYFFKYKYDYLYYISQNIGKNELKYILKYNINIHDYVKEKKLLTYKEFINK